MNVLLLKRWLQEEGPALIGTVLRGTRQVDAKTVVLRLTGEDGSSHPELLVSVVEDCPTVALLPPEAPELQVVLEPMGFAKAVRLSLRGYSLIGLEQEGFDRSVVFRFYHRAEDGQESLKRLQVELAGRSSNAYLISERGMVVSMLKPVRPGTNRVRTVRTGKPLPPPPPLGKFVAAVQDSSDLAAELARPPEADPLRELLTRRVAGGEVKLWPALEPLVPVKHDLETLHTFIADVQAGEFTDRLFGLHSSGDANRIALAAWRSCMEQQDPRPRAGTKRDRSAQKRSDLERQLQISSRADELEQLGLEMLGNAAGWDVAGARHHMDDWIGSHSEWAAEIDPLATAATNAAHLVEFSQRLRRGHEKLTRLLAELDAHGAPTDSESRMVSQAVRPRSPKPDPLTARLERRGVKYLRLTSSDGMPIFCGLSDASNDGLLREFGNARHLWLHARDHPGSHVILASNGADIPRRTLEEAATVAAYHSKAKKEHSVEVSYVSMKHVRKPKGSKPGLVHISHEKVISIQPGRFEEWRPHLLREVNAGASRT